MEPQNVINEFIGNDTGLFLSDLLSGEPIFSNKDGDIKYIISRQSKAEMVITLNIENKKLNKYEFVRHVPSLILKSKDGYQPFICRDCYDNEVTHAVCVSSWGNIDVSHIRFMCENCIEEGNQLDEFTEIDKQNENKIHKTTRINLPNIDKHPYEFWTDEYRPDSSIFSEYEES